MESLEKKRINKKSVQKLMEVSLNFSKTDKEIWDMYKKAEACFWTVEEVDLENDIVDWNKLTADEKFFVKRVLSFFASADIVVADNVSTNFSREFNRRDVAFFYDFQIMIENIHSEMYTTLLEKYARDKDEVQDLLHISETSSVIADKVKWMQKWCDSKLPLSHRVVAFACVEGIFFSASFCSIFWLKKRGLMPGLSFSNELIMRDEGMHRDFACLLNNKFLKCDKGVIQNIVKEAVEIEMNFVKECLPVQLIGMNMEHMCSYVCFVADHLLTSLNCDSIYNIKNPFDWMELISLNGKTNFFEKRVSDYRKAGVGMECKRFSVDEDF